MREYRQKRFVYLLDDERKTAWIKRGHIGRCRRYRLPDHVMVGGVRYTVEGMEALSFNKPRTLRRIVVPDSYRNVAQELVMSMPSLRSIHIGKGVESLDAWNFTFCCGLRVFSIDKDNPFLEFRDGMIVEKGGGRFYTVRYSRPDVTIPDGVTEIGNMAFALDVGLETVRFPETLHKIGKCSFSNCSSLRSVVLPEGFRECGNQSFLFDDSLTLIDFPSTLADMGHGTFAVCLNLQTLILRMPAVYDGIRQDDLSSVPVETCRLYVPADLVEGYRRHPVWGKFGNIQPIGE